MMPTKPAGMYSAALAWARMARIIASLPPSPRLILWRRRSLITRYCDHQQDQHVHARIERRRIPDADPSANLRLNQMREPSGWRARRELRFNFLFLFWKPRVHRMLAKCLHMKRLEGDGQWVV